MKKKNATKKALIAEKAFREAVKGAIESHAKSGVPAVFIKNRKICYRMPDGIIIDTPPESSN